MQVMTDTVVRRGLSAEIPSIADVIRAANEAYRPVAPADFFAAYLASALDLEGRLRDGGTVLVAERDGAIVGTVTYFQDARWEAMPMDPPLGTAGLRATAVHPVHQGLGIGRALVAACLERARGHAAERMLLHTAAFMVPAIELYERLGFVREPSLDYPVDEFFPSEPTAGITAMAFQRSVP